MEKAHSVAIDPNDSKILYVGTWRLAYKSVDFGKTWVRLIDRGMVLDSDVMSFSINSKNPEEIYSSACSGVYRSTNGAAEICANALASRPFCHPNVHGEHRSGGYQNRLCGNNRRALG